MELSERKEKILAAVVEQYIKTGEPVGSKALLDSLDMSVSSATVRNEMADLGYLGLLDQPHTSAGRVPTGEGYRYYVDNLVPESELSEESRRLIDAGIGNANGDPESLLRHAGEALAYLTQCAAVMTTPSVLNLIPRGVPAAISESPTADTLTAEKIIIAVKITVSRRADFFFVIFPLSGGMFFHKRSAASFMRYFFVPFLICEARSFLCPFFV